MDGAFLLSGVLSVETDSYNQTLDNLQLSFDLSGVSGFSNTQTTVAYGTPFIVQNVSEFIYIRASGSFVLGQNGETNVINGFFVSQSNYGTITISNPQSNIPLQLLVIWC